MKNSPRKIKENEPTKEKMKKTLGNNFIENELNSSKSNEQIFVEDEVKNTKEANKMCTKTEKEQMEAIKVEDFQSENFYESYKAAKDDLWWLIFCLLTVAAILTRLHHITLPNAVVWDETHFGKMAGWYLNRTFFFDVHPPGGKMLLALFGFLSSYNGSHPFLNPGLSYEGYEGIIPMRVGCALIGAGMIPLSFLIVWELTSSLVASSFAGLLCCCEIGWINLSKFILLDPILMFFMMCSFHALCMFHQQRERPWKKKWWFTLAYNGISIGCTLSVKFVGIFITLTVGTYTVLDLWGIYCDKKNSLVDTLKHFVARSLCLIFVPIAVYVGIFFIHDKILIYAAPASAGGITDIGSAMFSPSFQKRLVNSSLYQIKQPSEVTYGSVITLKSDNLGGGYLHSHNASYPEKYVKGNLQQITFISMKDFNNYYRVLFPFDDPDTPEGLYDGVQEAALNDNWVRLHHTATNATLACHRNKSTVASKMNLVYGRAYNLRAAPAPPSAATSPFLGDVWAVRTERGGRDEPLRTLRTRFQLIHAQYKCALTWSKEKLPLWGFGQGEASCTRNLKDPFSFLIAETVTNPRAKNVSFDDIASGFWSRLVESHRVMTFVNARLKPTENEAAADRPWMWPILYRAQPWYDINFRIVLLGNPLLFLLNFLSLLVTPTLLLGDRYRRRRNPERHALREGRRQEDGMTEERFIFSIKWIWIAYLFNYVPFFAMNRILYFHHYFPSQIFACLLTAILIARLLAKLQRTSVWRGSIAAAALLLTLSFLLYCYVAYGVPTTGPFHPDNSTFRRVRFNEDWHI